MTAESRRNNDELAEVGERRIFSSIPRKSKILWISSPGGHLAESLQIDQILRSNTESLWVTADTTQAKSSLVGRRTLYLPYVAPRDLRGSFRTMAAVAKVLSSERFDACVSTGAAMAGAAVAWAASKSTRTFYIESLARTDGPSLTGRALRLHPRVQKFTQYSSWLSGTWRFEGGLWDQFHTSAGSSIDGSLRILVTLGTIRPYAFDRAVDAVLAIVRPGDDVTWQLGATTPRSSLPGRVLKEVPEEVLRSCMREADVVITHAGVGSTLLAHELGKKPILAVRSAMYEEHVDDHQDKLATALEARDLCVRLPLDGSASRSLMSDVAGARVLRATSELD